MAWPRKNKYGAKKTTLDGIVFDSKAEANYYAMLKLREKAGEVHAVELQKPFVIAINGKVVCTYKADFAFHDEIEKRHRVIDVKGMDTPVSRLKRKLVQAAHGVEVEIVKA